MYTSMHILPDMVYFFSAISPRNANKCHLIHNNIFENIQLQC